MLKNALEKVSAKMESFYELDFDGFVKELKQKIPPKLKLEWLEVFEDTKRELLDLNQQIDSTDNEINQLVYQLYGYQSECPGLKKNMKTPFSQFCKKIPFFPAQKFSLLRIIKAAGTNGNNKIHSGLKMYLH